MRRLINLDGSLIAMSLADDDVPTQVDRLRTIAALTNLLFRTPKALKVWNRNNLTGQEMPADYVMADGGFQTFEGLVIGGTWEDEHGWLFDCEFKLFTDDAEVVTCYGWNLQVEVL